MPNAREFHVGPQRWGMRALSVYAGGMAALALPPSGWWFIHSVFADVLLERLGDWRFGWWYATFAVCALTVIEIRCLGTLFHLVIVRGRLDAFNARRNDPVWAARRSRRRMGMATVAVAFLAAFLIAEGGFRLFEIRPPPPPQPAAADYFAVNNNLNAWGLREPWDVLPDEDLRLRIVFLGDSIVYGDGIEREEAFCYLLEGLLAATRPEGVRTINMGYWGTAPQWQLEKFLALKDRIKPDLVVHVVYPNDLEIYMHRRLDEIYRIRDDALWLGEWSYVLRYAERTIRYWAAWKRTIDYFRGGRNSDERRFAWAKFKKDVRACKQAVEGSGAGYALVMFPWLVRLHDYDLPDVHEIMGEFARELGVPYLDLLDTFAGRDAEALRVSLANEHPNAEGHRLAAERLARFLREEVLPLRERK